MILSLPFETPYHFTTNNWTDALSNDGNPSYEPLNRVKRFLWSFGGGDDEATPTEAPGIDAGTDAATDAVADPDDVAEQEAVDAPDADGQIEATEASETDAAATTKSVAAIDN